MLSLKKRNLEILPFVKFDQILIKTFYHVFKSYFPYHRLASRSWTELFQSCYPFKERLRHQYFTHFGTFWARIGSRRKTSWKNSWKTDFQSFYKKKAPESKCHKILFTTHHGLNDWKILSQKDTKNISTINISWNL